MFTVYPYGIIIDSLQFLKHFSPENFHVITVQLHLVTLDKSGLKIDLELIIKLKTPLMIDSEFWDRFRALGRGKIDSRRPPL